MSKSIHSVRKITYIALLVALEIVLNRFCSINTAGLKIGFAFVPVTAAAYLLGSFSSAAVCALSDFIGAILFPIGPYHPGFTVCAALIGYTYGIFLYKAQSNEESAPIKWEKINFFPNILIPVVVNNLVFGLLINTIWVSNLYGTKTYLGWFMYRLPEYAVMIPVSLILIPIIIKTGDKLKASIVKK